MSILDRWYRGTLYPFEEIVPRNRNYYPLNEKIGSEREYFKGKLSSEDKERFEKWDELVLESSCMNGYANFSYGFKLGAMLMCEVFTEEDGSDMQD